MPESIAEQRARRLVAAAASASRGFKNPALGEMFSYAVDQKVNNDNPVFLEFMSELRQMPVDIETFLDSEEFLGATDLKLWPEVRKCIIGINKYWWKGPEHAIKEGLLCGATATGKSEIGKVCTAYHLHILGCLKNPQKIYSLPKETSIVFVIQAAKPHVTKKVVYTPLRNYVEVMPWFQKHMRPNKLIESEMYFDKINIRVVPGGSDSDTILGEAIIGGVLDEVNFMNIVKQSKKAAVNSGGRSGSYDQAKSIYDAVTRRRKGRFIYSGPHIGVICVSSSTRYKGDFTDKRKESIKRTGEKGVYVYDRAQYEVWPQERYCGENFRLLVENEAALDIRILDDEERAASGGDVYEVPIEYKDDFLKDPAGSLRDIVGRSVSSINPFFKRRFKIAAAVDAGMEDGLASFLMNDNVMTGIDGMPQVKPGHYCQNPSRPRYVHIDLAASGDRCGIGMIRWDGLVACERRGGITEHLPLASIELACTIEPSPGEEIDIAEVRAWVKRLKTVYGYPIKAVSYDKWGSIESRQQWRKQGMPVSEISVDRTVTPYLSFRDAFNDDRIRLYPQPVLEQELFDLEFDEKANGGKGKVDHPPHSSKDCADAVCGAYYHMLKKSSSWASATNGLSDPLCNRAEGDRYEAERQT